MSKSVKGNEKRHILALLRKHGLSGCKRALEAEGVKSPSFPTLTKMAIAAEIEIPGRGRPAVYDGKDKEHILALIRKHGSHKVAREILESEGKPCPTPPMMVRYAQEAGITVKRGRPVEAA
jgi:hypothetical protein